MDGLKRIVRNVLLGSSGYGGNRTSFSRRWVCCLVFAVGFQVAVHGGWYDSAWRYRKEVSIHYATLPAELVAEGAINTAALPAGDLVDFPLLVSLVPDNDLAAHARENGCDIVFTASDGETLLPHELEVCDVAAGTLTAWVRVPRVLSETKTTIQMYYGNPGATVAATAADVWDSDYGMVQHLNEPDSVHCDSTRHANHGTALGQVKQNLPGQIGKAVGFTAAEGSIAVISPTRLGAAGGLTLEAWLHASGSGGKSAGTIGKAVDSLDLGRSSMSPCRIVHVSGAVYAMVFTDDQCRGWVKTVEIAADGSIADHTVDELIFDADQGNQPDIVRLSGDIYVITYQGAKSAGFVATVAISSNGLIANTVIDAAAFDSSECTAPRLVRVNGSVCAAAYEGPQSVGYIKTVRVNQDGALDTGGAPYAFDAERGRQPVLEHVAGDIYAVVYQGADGDGFVRTVAIPDQGQPADSGWAPLEFDAVECRNPDIAKVSGDIFAVVYSGQKTCGAIKTLVIRSTGELGDAAVDAGVYEKKEGIFPCIVRVGGEIFAVAYTSKGSDGYVGTLAVSSGGAISQGCVDKLEFEKRAAYCPCLVRTGADTYAVAYAGASAGNATVKTLAIAGVAGIFRANAYGIGARDDSAGSWLEGSSLNVPLDAGWNHVAMTYDPGLPDNQHALYVNGSAAAAATTGPLALDSSLEFVIGAGFAGEIDEVRVSGKARSGAWLTAGHMNQRWPDRFCEAGPEEESVLAAPQVSNGGGAVRLTPWSGRLTGLVTAGSPVPDVVVFWGKTDGGPDASGWENRAELGGVSGAFAVDIDGLTLETTYYYRCYATNSLGQAWAAQTASFTAPGNSDLDGDLIPDWWEDLHGLDKFTPIDPRQDSDSDGVPDISEYACNTDPTNAISIMRILSADATNNADMGFSFWLGARRTVKIQGSAVDDGAWTTLASLDTGAEGVHSWVDRNAASAVPRRYYRVSVDHGGLSYTNPELWAMYVQERSSSGKYLVSVPVDLGDGNRLNGRLGRQLAGGLHAGARKEDGDVIYFRTPQNDWKRYYLVEDVDGTVQWWDFDVDGPGDLNMAAGTAFWVERKGAQPQGGPRCVFAGKCFTNAPPMLFSTNGAANGWTWTVFGWPFPKAGKLRNLGIGATPANQLGFAAVGHGGRTADYDRPHSQKGDQIWVWENNTFKDCYWLIDGVSTDRDGRWWSSRKGALADLSLEPGKAYFYRHHVSTDHNTTGTNFWWVPTPTD